MNDINSSSTLKSKFRRLLLALGVMGLASILTIIWLLGGFDREPSYRGGSATYWLDQMANSPEPGPSIAAFREMGRDAVPFLIKILSRKPSAMAQKVCEYAEEHNFPDWVKKNLPDVDRTDERRSNAALLLGALGPQAASAIPTLGRLMIDPGETDGLPEQAAAALEAMGPAAAPIVPQLIKNLGGTNQALQGLSAAVLGSIGPAARAALPALKAATGSSAGTSFSAIEAIWNISHDTNLVLGFLTAQLKETDAGSRRMSLMQFEAMGPAAKACGPMIQELLGDREDFVRTEAEKALRCVDPALLDGYVREINESLTDRMPALIAAIQGSDPRNTLRALQAVTVLGPKAAAAVPAILEILNQPQPVATPGRRGLPRIPFPLPARSNSIARPPMLAFDDSTFIPPWRSGTGMRVPAPALERSALLALAEIGPEARVVVPKLIALIQDRSARASTACFKALGGMGAEARPAIPALQAQLEGDDQTMRFLAAEALSRIAPEQSSNTLALLESCVQENLSIPSPRGESILELRASVALWRLRARPEPPLKELLAVMKKRPSPAAIDLLGDIGPEAKAALPLLEKLAQPEATFRRSAAIAIRKIDPAEAARLGLPGVLALP